MTLSRMERRQIGEENRCKPVKIGQALQYYVKEAFQQNRLMVGALQCAQTLKRNSGSVVLCILQKTASVAPDQHIQRKLLEAFCRENNVRTVQVESCAKLLSDVSAEKFKPTSMDDSQEETNGPQGLFQTDCLLIRKSDVFSIDEDFVLAYHDMAMFSNLQSCPFINLPV